MMKLFAIFLYFYLHLFCFIVYGQEIRDAYLKFPFKHSSAYALSQSELNMVVIDEQNAYIQIINYENGVPDEVSFTYFLKSDGSRVYGFQYFNMGGAGSPESETDFYTFDGKNWLKITDKILPKLTFEDFWGKDRPLPTPETLRQGTVDYRLPRLGTTIQVELLARSIVDAGTLIELGYPQVFAQRKYKIIELNWNMKLGIFEVGRRY